MDREHFPKLDNPTGARDEKGWCIHREDGIEKVFLSCPGIRGMSRITHHSIEPNGEVNASVLCTQPWGDEGMNEYHAFVVLDNWDTAYRKNAGDEGLTKI